MSNPPNKKTVTKELKGAFRAVNDDIAAHKWKWAGVCFLHGWLITMMFVMPAALFYLFAALECIMLAYTGRIVGKILTSPGRQVQQWALEQNQHQTMQHLKGDTAEELEQLLQYHMDNGNIAAADKISQRLLNMVDGTPLDPDIALAIAASAPPLARAATTPDDGVVLQIGSASSSGLPAWLQDGEKKEEKDEQAEQAQPTTLPDWMRS